MRKKKQFLDTWLYHSWWLNSHDSLLQPHKSLGAAKSKSSGCLRLRVAVTFLFFIRWLKGELITLTFLLIICLAQQCSSVLPRKFQCCTFNPKILQVSPSISNLQVSPSPVVPILVIKPPSFNLFAASKVKVQTSSNHQLIRLGIFQLCYSLYFIWLLHMVL